MNKSESTCWLSLECQIPGQKLSDKYTENDLKEFIEIHSKKFGNFQSIKLNYNMMHNAYQCFINFTVEESGKNAVDFFNHIEVDDLAIKAELRKPNLKENPLMASGIKFKIKEGKSDEKKIAER